MVLELGDPDGLWEIVPFLTASANGVPGDFYNLLQYFVILELDDTHARLAAGPVIPQLPATQFRVTANGRHRTEGWRRHLLSLTKTRSEASIRLIIRQVRWSEIP